MPVGIADPIQKLIADAKTAGTDLSINPANGKLRWGGKTPAPELLGKIRANKDLIIKHLTGAEPSRAIGNTLFGLPAHGAISGAQMLMAIPQMLLAGIGLPEEEAIARVAGPRVAEWMASNPIKSGLMNKALRTATSMGAGYLGGGKTGAAIGAGSEILGWPLEVVGPIKRLLKRSKGLPMITAADTGDVIADYFDQTLPNFSSKIRQNVDRFRKGLAAKNWATLLTRPDVAEEMRTAYDDGMAMIEKDLRGSIRGHYQQKIAALQRQAGVATPQQAMQITQEISRLQHEMQQKIGSSTGLFQKLKALKASAGQAAFKDTGETRSTAEKLNLINAYNAASAHMHNFMEQMDNIYGSNMTNNLEKLDNQYNSFHHLRGLASDPKLRHPTTGGIDRRLLQNKLQDPESAKVEKAFGPQKYEKLQESSGLDPATGTSLVPGHMPVRFRANPMYGGFGSYFGIPKLPFDPKKNIPGILSPTSKGLMAGGLVKGLSKALVLPYLLEKMAEQGQASEAK